MISYRALTMAFRQAPQTMYIFGFQSHLNYNMIFRRPMDLHGFIIIIPSPTGPDKRQLCLQLVNTCHTGGGRHPAQPKRAKHHDNS